MHTKFQLSLLISTPGITSSAVYVSYNGLVLTVEMFLFLYYSNLPAPNQSQLCPLALTGIYSHLFGKQFGYRKTVTTASFVSPIIVQVKHLQFLLSFLLNLCL